MAHYILRPSEICRRNGICRSTLYNWIRAGLWPELIDLGPRLVGQPEREVDELIAARIAGKSDTEIRALVLRLKAARKTADQGEPAPDEAERAATVRRASSRKDATVPLASR